MAATVNFKLFVHPKIWSQKLFKKIYNHITHDMEMCMWFQGFTEI